MARRCVEFRRMANAANWLAIRARPRRGRAAPWSAVVAGLLLLPAALPARSTGTAAAGAVAPSQAMTLSLAGQVGGAVQAVAAVGKTTYVGVGPRLVILEACDPHRPLLLGQSEPFEGIASSVLVADGIAYVAASSAGLVVLDVRVPARPAVIGRLAINGVAARMVLAEGLLYAAAGAGGMHIIDVRQPAAPHLVGTFPKIATDVAVKDQVAYVVARDLMVVDVSDPAAPRQIDALTDWSEVVEVGGDYLYAALSNPTDEGDREGFLQVYSLANPSRPRRLGRTSIGLAALDLALDGPRAYALSGGQLRSIHIEDPNRPYTLGTVGMPPTSLRLGAGSGAVYVAAVGAGLYAADVRDPTAMRGGASWTTLGSAEAVIAAKGFVYVEDEGAGDRIVAIDVRDPQRPQLRGAVPIGVNAEALAVQGSTLYVGAPDDTLRVVDIHQPEAPRLVGALALPEPIWALEAAGEYLYVANDERLRVVDARNPANPTVVGSTTTIGGATDLAVEHPFAYVTGPATGLQLGKPSFQVVDVSDPYRPHQAGFTSAAGWNSGLAMGAGHAFLGGLQVIDVRDPGIPREVARLGDPRDSRNNTLSNGYLYVAQRRAGLRGRLEAYDVTSPQRPVAVAALELPDDAQDVAVVDRTAYVAAHLGGLVLAGVQANLPPPLPTEPPPVRPELPQRAFLPLAARGPVGPACR
jgi:hypothetical protein